jgi:hypothetical protein
VHEEWDYRQPGFNLSQLEVTTLPTLCE